MPENFLHVLMTGGGAPGAAGILKCLKRQASWNITVADANPEAIGKHLHHQFEEIPPAIAPLFISFLIELCRKQKITVILPLVTRELLPLATHRELFEKAGIQIPISSAASLEIANNKSRLYEFMQWRDIPVPAFRIVENAQQFIAAIHELGYPQKQVCFKPSVSNGSRGFRILSWDINEMDLLFNYKPNTTNIRLEDAERILSSGPFPELLVSDYLPGEEYSVDCLAKNGETILALPRLRKKMVNGISVEGEIVNDPAIIGYCSSIISALRLHGNIGIQVKRSADGQPLLLEINPRVQGTISACLGAGINMPVLAIKQELGLPIDPQELAVKWGIRFSRYWEEVYY
jgi:carbamoyl-phosphate synthase large subunit